MPTLQTGEAFYVAASIAFFKGLQVYPQPQVGSTLSFVLSFDVRRLPIGFFVRTLTGTTHDLPTHPTS